MRISGRASLRRPRASSLARLGPLLTLLLLPACSFAPNRLEPQQAVATQRWQELAAEPTAPVAAIGWTEAVQKLEANNPKLRNARERVRASEEAVRQVPHNYIPELTLNLFGYPTLGEIGDGTLGNTFFYLGSLINLPNPMRYRAEATQARLRYLSAQLEAEVLRRDLYVQLYRLFRSAAPRLRADTETAALRWLAAASPDSPAASQARELATTNHTAWQGIESETAELLGDYSRHWRPQPGADLPVLDYATHPPALDGRNQFAALQITRAGLQLAALEAQRQGLLAIEWPQFSVFLSAPPIYQRSAG
ncbi:MAG: TolC family protein, partial [Opitutaceae bacterium]|nr:TolC family protein [Opitutaceae bacterium]